MKVERGRGSGKGKGGTGEAGWREVHLGGTVQLGGGWDGEVQSK